MMQEEEEEEEEGERLYQQTDLQSASVVSDRCPAILEEEIVESFWCAAGGLEAIGALLVLVEVMTCTQTLKITDMKIL